MINKDGNLYTFSFAILLVCIVGTTLAVASQGLKTKQLKNASDKKMISILSAVNIDANRINAKSLFDKYILKNESKVISGLNIRENSFNIDIKKEYRNTKISFDDRNYPLFVCKKDTSTYYIIPVVGTGLWGPIWGYISLESDLKTIYGANFVRVKNQMFEFIKASLIKANLEFIKGKFVCINKTNLLISRTLYPQQYRT